jgi:hypothetical protein
MEICSAKEPFDRIGPRTQGKNDMVAREMKPNVRLAILSSVIAGLLANATPLMAADPGSTRAAAPQAESKQNPSGDDLRICFRPWRGQQLVQLESRATDIRCLADSATFVNDGAVLQLRGNVLVDVKGNPTLYLANRISVYPKTELVVIEEKASAPTVAMPAAPSERIAKAEKLWSEYKLDFLVRLTRRIDVVEISDNGQVDNFCPGSTVRLLTCKTLIGNTEPIGKRGDLLFLRPETHAKKVMIVDYFGREPRNWIPYDELLEAKIIALSNKLNAH